MTPVDSTNAIITGTIRSLAQLVPMAGGAIAQAWSEYDNFRQNQRIEEFFARFREQLERLERHQADLHERIKSMPDAAELMELAVAAAKRETSETKRQLFPQLYSNFLAAPGNTTPPERLDLIHHVEQLSEVDLNLLKKFARSSTLRGDALTTTLQPTWSALGQQPPDSDWLIHHGGTVHSLAKLIARGLLHDAVVNAQFTWSGDASSSFNQFRRKAWTITPMGQKLLQGLRPI